MTEDVRLLAKIELASASRRIQPPLFNELNGLVGQMVDAAQEYQRDAGRKNKPRKTGAVASLAADTLRQKIATLESEGVRFIQEADSCPRDQQNKIKELRYAGAAAESVAKAVRRTLLEHERPAPVFLK
jgi:hypothetical protein